MRFIFAPIVIFLMTMAAFAQSSPDYNGTWVLDTQKTKLDERLRVESMTVKITDKVTEVTKVTAVKRSGQGAGPGGRGMGGGMGGGLGLRDGSDTFILDGKERTVVEEGPRGPMSVKVKGKREKDGKIVISTSRALNGPMGEIEISSKETWVLASDGKSLTVTAELSSPMGGNSNKLHFVRQ